MRHYCKVHCKRTKHCWLTIPNVVGCYMLRPFAYPVACCWELLGKAGLKPVKLLATRKRIQRARSIQPKFLEISVQNSMDRFGPTRKVLKTLVHLLRWTTFPGRTGRKFWLNGSRPTVPNNVGSHCRPNECCIRLHAA